MAILEHQHLRRVDLVGADHRGQVLRLVAGESDEQRIVEQILGFDIAARVGEREQDAIDGAMVQRFARLRARFLAQEKLERRAFLAEPRQQAGEEEGGDRRNDAHPEFADERRGGGGGHVGEFLSLAQHAVRLFDDRVAEPGKADDAAGAFDERLTKQRFKLADARRQRRLGDVAAVGGAAEMAMLVERDEILHLFQRGEVIVH